MKTVPGIKKKEAISKDLCVALGILSVTLCNFLFLCYTEPA